MKILYPPSVVNDRIEEIAHEIVAQYHTNKPLFICLLKGAVPFTSKLLSAVARIDPNFHPEVEYLHVSAYGENRIAGRAEIYAGVDNSVISGRHIIVIDDCLDRGITYTKTKKYLQEQGANSVDLVVLANKDVPRATVDQPLISGFHVPNVWLIGMGMDDSAAAPEAERWADYIGDAS